jgi:hypothetical protein
VILDARRHRASNAVRDCSARVWGRGPQGPTTRRKGFGGRRAFPVPADPRRGPLTLGGFTRHLMTMCARCKYPIPGAALLRGSLHVAVLAKRPHVRRVEEVAALTWRDDVITVVGRSPASGARLPHDGAPAELLPLGRLVAVVSSWIPAVELAGIPDNPHPNDLRHSYVAMLIRMGLDVKAIQTYLGHASIRTTFDVYGSLLPEADERLIRAFHEVGGARVARIWHEAPDATNIANGRNPL